MSRQKSNNNPVFIVLIIVFILLILSLIKNAIGLYQSRNRLEAAKISVSKLESDKQKLVSQISLQSDPASIDQIIHNKLNLALPGDTVVIITGTESSNATLSAIPTPTPSAEPAYLQWWHLFTK